MSRTANTDFITDLLLCGHHYRRNRAALSALVAMVYRQDGSVVTR